MKLIDKLIAALPGPSALNFLAGLFAGAGINMLTSMVTGPSGNVWTTTIVVIDSLLWVLAAGFLVRVARILEDAEREAQLVLTGRRITGEEKQEIWADYRAKAQRLARIPVALTVLWVFLALLLLLGLLR